MIYWFYCINSRTNQKHLVLLIIIYILKLFKVNFVKTVIYKTLMH